jgi:hypothetical protein
MASHRANSLVTQVKEEFENDPEFLKDYAVKPNGESSAPPTTTAVQSA